MSAATVPFAPAPMPLACHFGPSALPLSGWFHGTRAGSIDMAVLVCPPIGDEALSVYRGLRHLAEELAAAGLPTLRFDYAGTGDSADPPDAAEGDQVAVWLASVDCAIEALKAACGASSVALIGVRNGSLIAVQAAKARSDVAAMVALAPVQNGRGHLRECRLLAASLGHAPAADGAVQAGGHRHNAATVARFGTLDWCRDGDPASPLPSLPPLPSLLPLPVPPRTLVIDRDDLPLGATCVQRLRGLGCTVTHELQPGLERLTALAHESHLPAVTRARIVEWLGAVPALSAHRSAQDAASHPAAQRQPDAGRRDRISTPGATALRTGGVRLPTSGHGLWEEWVTVASSAALSGVVSRGVGTTDSGRGVVLLSTGCERQIGPHRALVEYARARAARGDTVLRVDRAGIGDSPVRPGGREADAFDPRAADDVAAAVAFLRERHGVRSCTVVGFCAGAFHAWRAAVGGLQFERLVSVNPVAYAASASQLADPRRAAFQLILLADARRSIVDLQRWRQVLRGELRLGGVGEALVGRMRARWGNAARHVARLLRRPLVDDLAVDITALNRRGVRQHLVFSADEPGWVMLREQGGGALKRLLHSGGVHVAHLPGADHTCTTEAARAALYAALHTALDAAPGHAVVQPQITRQPFQVGTPWRA